MSTEIEKAKETLTIWRSGFVNRYHSHYDPRLRNSQDLTDAHSARMVKMLMALRPDLADRECIMYIIMHDAPEFAAGDSPHHAKRRSPELKKALDNLEAQEMIQFEELCDEPFSGLGYLTSDQYAMVRMLDQLDSLLYQASLTPDRMSQERPLIDGILEQARSLDIGEEVRLLMIKTFHFYGSNFVPGSKVISRNDMEANKEAYRV